MKDINIKIKNAQEKLKQPLTLALVKQIIFELVKSIKK